MDTPLARLSRGATLEEESFAGNLIGGLTQTPKEIACKYFYDETGSRLFDAICELPEYYQTRTETALLARHAGEIAALMGPGIEIVEFGAGSLRKVRILLDALQSPRAYTPLDISGEYLGEVVRSHSPAHSLYSSGGAPLSLARASRSSSPRYSWPRIT